MYQNMVCCLHFLLDVFSMKSYNNFILAEGSCLLHRHIRPTKLVPDYIYFTLKFLFSSNRSGVQWGVHHYAHLFPRTVRRFPVRRSPAGSEMQNMGRWQTIQHHLEVESWRMRRDLAHNGRINRIFESSVFSFKI